MISPPLPPFQTQAEILARTLPYIQRFHGKTLVVKYGGNAMTDAALQKQFAQDVVLLTLVGMKLVVVHGGGPQIDRVLDKLGKQSHFIQGMRVTDAETMEAVEWALVAEVQQAIVGLIQASGGRAVGLTGRDGGLLRASQLMMPDPERAGCTIDLGHVGEVESVNIDVVRVLLDQHFVPVVSPIALGPHGQAFNVNADSVAAHLAVALQAEKLLMLSNIPGVLDKTQQLLPVLTPEQIDALVADGTISGGMLPKIAGALSAAQQGVGSVHIVDGRIPHALMLELLTDRALGTMLTPKA